MEEKLLLREVPNCSLPRERLQAFGEQALSEQELLAIVLRTGHHNVNVMELAAQLLNQFTSLYELKQATIEELMTIKGIGVTKAIELKAVLELGIRTQQAMQPKIGKINGSYEIAQRLIRELRDYQQEHLVCLFLNTKNEIIQQKTLFIGSLNQSVAHPREIFRWAVRCSAARVIVCHNHPSGNPEPSNNDIAFTKRLIECGEIMGIELLDHIITGSEKYTSLRETGLWSKKR